jgi:hypothetical protein
MSLPPRGVEHLQRNPEDPQISDVGAAKSGAFDASLREIIEAWPDVADVVRDAVPG